jgi:lipoate-protein ligase B
VTLHAPGQLVAYVVMRLGGRRSIHGHVRNLEDAMIRVLTEFGVDAQAQCDGAGVWTDQRKIASVGVAIDHWVSYHGLAINICNDLSLFDWIVPCGQSDVRMTRLNDLVPRPIEVGAVADAFAAHFADLAGLVTAEDLA